MHCLGHHSLRLGHKPAQIVSPDVGLHDNMTLDVLSIVCAGPVSIGSSPPATEEPVPSAGPGAAARLIASDLQRPCHAVDEIKPTSQLHNHPDEVPLRGGLDDRQHIVRGQTIAGLSHDGRR